MQHDMFGMSPTSVSAVIAWSSDSIVYCQWSPCFMAGTGAAVSVWEGGSVQCIQHLTVVQCIVQWSMVSISCLISLSRTDCSRVNRSGCAFVCKALAFVRISGGHSLSLWNCFVNLNVHWANASSYLWMSRASYWVAEGIMRLTVSHD